MGSQAKSGEKRAKPTKMHGKKSLGGKNARPSGGFIPSQPFPPESDDSSCVHGLLLKMKTPPARDAPQCHLHVDAIAYRYHDEVQIYKCIMIESKTFDYLIKAMRCHSASQKHSSKH